MFQVFSHTSKEQTVRNKIFFPHNLVSFLEQGEKVVHYAGSKTIIAEGYFVILSSGKCLMTEKIAVNNVYSSTMLSFNDISILNFFVKYASVLNNASRNLLTEKKSFLVFKKDEFIKNFITSLKLLHSKKTLVSDQILALKFEELMLYLFEKYPSEILSFQTKNQENFSDFEIRRTVEMHKTSNLSLEEMAFLCHTSISTFKRRFLKLYNENPSTYFLKTKMEMAKTLLLENHNPSDVYHLLGYESHSSFSQSFKKTFGITPKEFQEQNLNVLRQILND